MRAKMVVTVVIAMMLLANVTYFIKPAYAHMVSVDLIAGGGNPASQIIVGSVSVWNDDEHLYVKYSVDSEGWFLIEVHVHVGENLNEFPLVGKPGNPVPGRFDYAEYFNVEHEVTYWVVVIDLKSDWEVGDTLYVAAHAVVVHISDSTVDQQETAWGAGIRFTNKGNWATYFTYIVQEWVPGQEEGRWEDETAWAQGSRYVERGNWAMYVEYSGVEKTVYLVAGQFYDAGTVTFSEPNDGTITITITLNNGFRFDDVHENVKVQDYSEPPSGNPNPGSFLYKTDVPPNTNYCSIEVPLNNFYGVHVDVEMWVPSSQ